MSLFPKTSADTLFTQLDGDADATLPKYSYETTILADGSAFAVDNLTNWGVNKDVIIRVDDPSFREITVTDFVHAVIDTTQSDQSVINVIGAKRGDIDTGSGDDTVHVDVLNSLNAGAPGFDDPNFAKNAIFFIDTGDGNDSITFARGVPVLGLNTDRSEFIVTQITAGNGDDHIDLFNGDPLL